MIRSVTIQNLRGIRDGRLDALGALAVLVGPNGSGKSTVLDAILIGASARPYEAAARVIQRRAVPGGRRWLLWRAGEGGSARIQVVSSAGETRTCSLRGLRRLPEGAAAAGGRAADPALAPLAGVPEVRLVEAVPRGSDTPLHVLWLQAVEHGRDSEAESYVRPLLPGLRRLEAAEDEGTPFLQLVFADHSLPAALAGDGIRKLLRLALELAACPAGVVLLEEPELHQHLLALRQTARALASAVERGLQLVLTTQSLELLDLLLAILPEEGLERLTLYRLVLEAGALGASGMPGGDVAVLRKAIEEDLR